MFFFSLWQNVLKFTTILSIPYPSDHVMPPCIIKAWSLVWCIQVWALTDSTLFENNSRNISPNLPLCMDCHSLCSGRNMTMHCSPDDDLSQRLGIGSKDPSCCFDGHALGQTWGKGWIQVMEVYLLPLSMCCHSSCCQCQVGRSNGICGMLFPLESYHRMYWLFSM